MEELILEGKEFNKLKRINLGDVLNTESNFLSVPNDKNNIVKAYIDYKNTKFMNSKLETINNLIDFTNKNNIDYLVIPNKKLIVEDEFRGIVLPKINGKNASKYLRSNNISLKVKIEILKQIGSILESIHNINSNISYSDVHSDNFMVTNDLKVYGIDTDSMKFNNLDGNLGYYFDGNRMIYKYDKYKINNNDEIISNYNTDIYSYVMMILEVISNEELIVLLDENEFDNYIEYLDKLGFNSKLLEAISSIYNNKIDNINPLPYLDTIKSIKKSNIYYFERYYNGNIKYI